jgi:mRNA interferase HicA
VQARLLQTGSAVAPGSLQSVHVYVYVVDVKRRELESRLRDLGWAFLRHGGNHDVWSDGDRLEYVPRHAEINENLARKILRKAATKRESES